MQYLYKDKRQIEARECILLLSSTVLAQQTVQEQTNLEHKKGSLMEPALQGKYSNHASLKTSGAHV